MVVNVEHVGNRPGLSEPDQGQGLRGCGVSAGGVEGETVATNLREVAGVRRLPLPVEAVDVAMVQVEDGLCSIVSTHPQ